MRRPKAVVGLAFFLTATVSGCSDSLVPTDASRAAAPGSTLAAKGVSHSGAIVAHDSCDPDSFNAALGEGTCVKNGPTTFDAFINELAATQTARAWRFNPLLATARAGQNMLAQNVGGEIHTFTPVREYGGGFIPELNALSNNPVPAPECLDFARIDFVAGGEKSIIPAADLASVADAGGVARVLCCLHPWMRADVRIK